jgi:hypothetical protein
VIVLNEQVEVIVIASIHCCLSIVTVLNQEGELIVILLNQEGEGIVIVLN